MDLEHQISTLEWFLMDHVTLKTGCWYFSFAITWIMENYYFTFWYYSK